MAADSTASPSSRLTIENLSVRVSSAHGTGLAVEDVSFTVAPRRTVALVGESGSGKTMTAMAIMGLLPANADRISGRLTIDGEVLFDGSAADKAGYRGRNIGIIVQDPLSSLDPVFRVGDQIGETLRKDRRADGQGAVRRRSIALLRLMRIAAPEARIKAYPHEMSGGMRQRVVGAIALAGEPRYLIADEPTTALDVTVQAAYMDLLREVQAREGLGLLFITHDLGVVSELADDVLVMYAGRIIEAGSREKVLTQPEHPYTKALLRSVPDIDELVERLVSIDGSLPPVHARPTGCRFHPRCWLHEDLGRPALCTDTEPSINRQPGCAPLSRVPLMPGRLPLSGRGAYGGSPAFGLRGDNRRVQLKKGVADV